MNIHHKQFFNGINLNGNTFSGIGNIGAIDGAGSLKYDNGAFPRGGRTAGFRPLPSAFPVNTPAGSAADILPCSACSAQTAGPRRPRRHIPSRCLKACRRLSGA